MKKRGFTLVELLAIILILAIIALITVPMVITLIRNARKSVFKSNAEQVLSASKMYYSKNITDDGVIIEIRDNQVNKLQYMNDTSNSEALPGFHLKGKLPQKGKITITDDGKIAFDLYNGDFCAYKTEEANTIYILEGDNCDKNVKIPKIEGTVATKDKDKAIEQFADPDITLLNEIEYVVRMLNNVEQYKYKLIENLYKCLDEVENWSDDSKASRKATIQKMIDIIAKED